MSAVVPPPPLPKFWGYLCLYQNFKATPFVGNKGNDTPLMHGTMVIFFPPYLRESSKKSTPLVERTTYYPLCKDHFQEIDPFIRENILPSLNITLF
jgi:hypothetical protein